VLPLLSRIPFSGWLESLQDERSSEWPGRRFDHDGFTDTVDAQPLDTPRFVDHGDGEGLGVVVPSWPERQRPNCMMRRRANYDRRSTNRDRRTAHERLHLRARHGVDGVGRHLGDLEVAFRPCRRAGGAQRGGDRFGSPSLAQSGTDADQEEHSDEQVRELMAKLVAESVDPRAHGRRGEPLGVGDRLEGDTLVLEQHPLERPLRVGVVTDPREDVTQGLSRLEGRRRRGDVGHRSQDFTRPAPKIVRDVMARDAGEPEGYLERIRGQRARAERVAEDPLRDVVRIHRRYGSADRRGDEVADVVVFQRAFEGGLRLPRLGGEVHAFPIAARAPGVTVFSLEGVRFVAPAVEPGTGERARCHVGAQRLGVVAYSRSGSGGRFLTRRILKTWSVDPSGLLTAPSDTLPTGMPNDLVGQVLAHFRILGKLGEGGMGVVYKATDEALGRVVALKILPETLVDDPERRARLLREARAAAAVTHPNIATVYEVGEAGGRVYIAMEHVEGATLRYLLAGGPLPVSPALQVAVQVARGLAKAHEKGIVHRDLKPDNVMVTPEGAKLLDFGLAKSQEGATSVRALQSQATDLRITAEGATVGTPAYMSPEQLEGDPVDARSDVFAFGITLFEMLTGAHPFPARSQAAMTAAIIRDEAARASKHDPRIPPGLDRIVSRCLEKKPSSRYPNAGALVADLEALVPSGAWGVGVSLLGASAPGVATAPTVAAPIQPRSKLRARAMLLVACLAGAGAGLGWVGIRLLASRTPSAAAVSPASGSHAPTSGSGAPAAPVATTLLDLPPPPTESREAAAEYAAGMQCLHDNSWSIARHHFERTIELDPTIAMAHLRLAMMQQNHHESRRRDEYAKAVGLRRQLGPRDNAVLEALEPVLQRTVDDSKEALARLEKTSERFPGDVELLDWVGFMKNQDPKGALEVAERAASLDPRDGQAQQDKGEALFMLGRAEEALETLERCAAFAVDAADCLESKVRLEEIEGRCADAEVDGRRLVDRDPLQGELLLATMVSLGRPDGTIAERITELERQQPDGDRPVEALWHRVRQALLAGDFGAADGLVGELRAQLARDPTKRSDYGWRERTTVARVTLLLEEGRADAAQSEAEDFVVRSEPWTQTSGSDFGVDEWPWLLRLTVGRGGLSLEEFGRRRDAWAEARLSRFGSYPGLVWPNAYAQPARTADDARRSMAELPRFAPLTSYALSDVPDAYVGHAYLVAGKAEEAVRYLQRAVNHCGFWFWPAKHVHAALELGQALEATGDRVGACKAYGEVLARWGHAKPRSVTLAKATGRVKALGCGR
jgi:eukaryotic-like serine/threonine-protein kinase